MDPTTDARPRKVVTLVMVHEGGRLLLAKKKAGFGGGWWNGFGGKVQPGETVEAAARRELMEEAGIDVRTLEKAGMLFFDIEGDERLHEGHIFRGAGIVGEPVETEEMEKAQWFPDNAIPYAEMWQGDDLWMPLFVKGIRFEGMLHFNDRHELLHADVKPVLGRFS